MTLRQIINHVMNRGAITHVTSCIHHSYYNKSTDYVVLLHQYTCVIRELLDLGPDNTYADHTIVLREVADDEHTYVDVHLEHDGTTFAVDYIDWTRLIDLQIRDDIGLQAHDILAHILWEITFHGFTNSKVKQSRETLENLCNSLSAE